MRAMGGKSARKTTRKPIRKAGPRPVPKAKAAMPQRAAASASRAAKPRATAATRAAKPRPDRTTKAVRAAQPRGAGAPLQGTYRSANYVEDPTDQVIDLGGHPGLLRRPPGARALYVFAHGAGAGMRHTFLDGVAGAFAAAGIATLRWEFPYMAAGKRRVDPPAIAEAAVQAVWAAARTRFTDLPLFAGGHSFGGRMTSRSHAASALPGIRGVIFFGFPLHPPDKPAIERADHLAAASGPLLFLQGEHDDFAPLHRLRPVVDALGARATLHVVAHADHGFHVLVRSGRTRHEVLAELAATAASWITRHV
ncbi:MAG TPA: alpha/beta family hydrolase [Kofleriaceae bacterium]|nr:alpha/beta family hydrolase [Kofleriaceae bacterium]